MDKTIYLLIRIDLSSKKEITEKVIEEVVQELDYSITSKTDGVTVLDKFTEIKESFDNYPNIV